MSAPAQFPDAALPREDSTQPCAWSMLRVTSFAILLATVLCGASYAFVRVSFDAWGASADNIGAFVRLFGWLPVVRFGVQRIQTYRSALLLCLVHGMAVGGFNSAFGEWLDIKARARESDCLALTQDRTIQGEMHYFAPPRDSRAYITALRVPAFEPLPSEVALGALIGGLITAAMGLSIWIPTSYFRRHWRDQCAARDAGDSGAPAA
jgi:hypothetical protein